MPDKNKLEYFIFLIFVKFFTLLGLSYARRFSKPLAFLFFYIVGIRKKVVLKNLRIAFPDLPEKEIKNIAFQNYYNFCITLIEILLLPKLKKSQIENLVSGDKLSVIKEKFEIGKGLILLTAHFGNWELGAISVASQLHIPFKVLAKPQRNGYVSNWLNNMRGVLGNSVIQLGVSVREVYTALKEGNIVGVVGDQRGPKESQRVKFFGQDTAVYSGTASIALKVGCPILMVMIVRQKDLSYRAEVIEIPTDDLTGEAEDKILIVNQRYMNILEKYVREYPEQWFWMHNIWKY
jgi:KDO2-lipid IV(A) lauroyltransferase